MTLPTGVVIPSLSAFAPILRITLFSGQKTGGGVAGGFTNGAFDPSG
jgi:hypothetical protein